MVALAKAGCKVRIGGNFYPDQAASFEQLLDRLEKSGVARLLDGVRFKPVVDTQQQETGTCTNCSYKGETQTLVQLNKSIEKRKMVAPVLQGDLLESMLGPCELHWKNSYTIDPDGNVYKCPAVAGMPDLAVAQVGSLFSADAWNNVTFTAGEVKNPSRNLPLSLALGTGVVIALYIACNFVYLNVLPLDGVANGATILERGIKFASEERVGTAVMTQMLGPVGGLLMAAAIMISGFGCNNGLILSGARVYYAMAKDGLFFRNVARLHPKYKTPAVSLMVQMLWTCVLCISGSYGQLLDYIIFAVLVFYILTIVGLFVLRRTRPNAPRPYRAIGYPVLPAIYIVMALFIDVVLLRYKPQFTWPGLIVVLLGIPVYYAWSRRSRHADTIESA